MHPFIQKVVEPLVSQSAQVCPFLVQKVALEKLLSQVFAIEIAEGDLDCLEGRWLKVYVKDMQIGWRITLSGNRVEVERVAGEADVTISGNAREFALLVSRQEDPDTLFFQRRLTIEGDTELGLEVKNILDALDHENLPFPLKQLLDSVSHVSRFIYAA